MKGLLFFAVLVVSYGINPGWSCQSGSDVTEACSTIFTRTKLQYYTTGSWWNTQIKSRYTTETVFGGHYCLNGYVLRGTKCYKTDCGRCDNKGIIPDTQRACLDTSTTSKVVSTLVQTTCGSWWSRYRCTKTVYRKLTESNTLYRCCDGALSGRTCTKNAGNTCGQSSYPDAGDRLTQIVGGVLSRPNEFPWQVELTSQNKNFLCGGTILSSKHILTAAHCLDNRQVHELVIFAGKHQRSTTESTQQRRVISTVHIHQSYDRDNLRNDIAVLVLSNPLTLTAAVQPACLPPANYNAAGKSAVISGWGRTATNGPVSSALQYTKVNVASKALCQVLYGGSFDNVLCGTDGSGDRSRSICFGDSGGPMAVKENGKFSVVGVASFVSGKGCAVGDPFGFTQVSSYVPWINEKMNS